MRAASLRGARLASLAAVAFLLVAGLHLTVRGFESTAGPREETIFFVASVGALALGALVLLRERRAAGDPPLFSQSRGILWSLADSAAVALLLWSIWCWAWGTSAANGVLLSMVTLAGGLELVRVVRARRELVLASGELRIVSESGAEILNAPAGTWVMDMDSDDRLRCHVADRAVTVGARVGGGVGGRATLDAYLEMLKGCEAAPVKPGPVARARTTRGVLAVATDWHSFLALSWVFVLWGGILSLGWGISDSFFKAMIAAYALGIAAAGPILHRELKLLGQTSLAGSPHILWLLGDDLNPRVLSAGFGAMVLGLGGIVALALAIDLRHLQSPASAPENAGTWTLFFGALVALSLMRFASRTALRRVLRSLILVSVDGDVVRVERPMALVAACHSRAGSTGIAKRGCVFIKLAGGRDLVGAFLSPSTRWSAFQEKLAGARHGTYR